MTRRFSQNRTFLLILFPWFEVLGALFWALEPLFLPFTATHVSFFNVAMRLLHSPSGPWALRLSPAPRASAPNWNCIAPQMMICCIWWIKFRQVGLHELYTTSMKFYLGPYICMVWRLLMVLRANCSNTSRNKESEDSRSVLHMVTIRRITSLLSRFIETQRTQPAPYGVMSSRWLPNEVQPYIFLGGRLNDLSPHPIGWYHLDDFETKSKCMFSCDVASIIHSPLAPHPKTQLLRGTQSLADWSTLRKKSDNNILNNDIDRPETEPHALINCTYRTAVLSPPCWRIVSLYCREMPHEQYFQIMWSTTNSMSVKTRTQTQAPPAPRASDAHAAHRTRLVRSLEIT